MHRVQILLSHFLSESRDVSHSPSSSLLTESKKKKKHREALPVCGPVVIGGVVVDLKGQQEDGKPLVKEVSNPGTLSLSLGGVGRNVAEVLARLSLPPGGSFTSKSRSTLSPFVISAIGNDLWREMIMTSFQDLGMRSDGLLVSDLERTACYMALLDQGHLVCAIADMKIFDHLTPDRVIKYEQEIRRASVVVMDANIPTPTISFLSSFADSHNVPVVFEPISSAKCLKVLESNNLSALTLISPNVFELIALSNSLSQASGGSGAPPSPSLIPTEDDTTVLLNENQLHEYKQRISQLLNAGVAMVTAKFGPAGVLVGSLPLSPSLSPSPQHTVLHELQRLNKARSVDKNINMSYEFKYFPAPPCPNLVKVTGAGDSFLGGLVGGLMQGEDVEKSVLVGMKCAFLSLMSTHTISRNISADLLNSAPISSSSSSTSTSLTSFSQSLSATEFH